MKRAALAATVVLAACSWQSASRAEPPLSTAPAQWQRPSPSSFKEEILYRFPLDVQTRSPIFPSSSLLVRAKQGFYGATSATAGFRGGIGALFEVTIRHELRVIARFGRKSGAYPSGVIADKAGALYGTTRTGGDLRCFPHGGCGAIFKLIPSGTSFVREILHRFRGGLDGIEPSGGIAVDANGALYGTTHYGGGPGCGSLGCGTVFRLDPEGTRYRETIAYRFTGGSDGSVPAGGVALDSGGNLYGVTAAGGNPCAGSSGSCGTVYELKPSGSSYTETILYRFAGKAKHDGAVPISLLPPASDGTLYGTTLEGGKYSCSGSGCGTVFKLTRSGSHYQETVLASFAPAPGAAPPQPSALLLRNNELYGVTALGGSHTSSVFPHGTGTVFAVNALTGSMSTIYEFKGAPDGAAPVGGLIAGRRGVLYGATANGGKGGCSFCTGWGTIYRLVPSTRT